MTINRVNLSLNDGISSVSATARDLVYSATNGIANIASATAYNSDAAAVDLYVAILTNTALTGTVQFIEKVTIGAGARESLANLIGHNVPSGGSIQAYAGTADVIYLTISGTTKN